MMEKIRCQSCFREYEGAVCPHCGGAQNEEHQLPVGTVLRDRYQISKVSGYRDARERSIVLWTQLSQVDTISSDEDHAMAIRADGTVIAVGNNDSGQCDVSSRAGIRTPVAYT